MGHDAEARVGWARDNMPLLEAIRAEFVTTRPFDGITIASRIHIEPKTAVLHETLAAGGARVIATGNQGTTQDDVADYLRGMGEEVLGERSDDESTMAGHTAALADSGAELVLDNGAEVIEAIVSGAATPPIGATEETTSGAHRLTERLAGSVTFPVIVINDSPLKSIVENKHGVGESIVDVIQRATNLMLHRKRFVVFGYGWCGRGIALYARSRGADVTVVEPDPIKALEAAFDGFRVEPADEAVQSAEVVVTATGRDGVLPVALLDGSADGVILANAGHDNREIDVHGLVAAATSVTSVSDTVTVYSMPNGNRIALLARGGMLNLAAAEGSGNPVETMDLGFAMQARSLELLARDRDGLPSGRQPVPDPINRQVAAAMTAIMMKRG